MIWLKTPKTLPTILTSIQSCPDGTRITLDQPKHSDAQQNLMWSLCGQLASKATYHGLKLAKEDWKLVALSGLRSELRVVPNLNNDGFIQLNSIKPLSKAEMGMLIEIIEAWAATNGYTLTRTMPGYEE